MPTKYKKVPWKRNLRVVPEAIRDKLRTIESDIVSISISKKVKDADIASGRYSHLGLVPGTTDITRMPPDNMGKYSHRNQHGWEIKRTDLPMITKTFFWETPNFGDAATYGTHTHFRDRDVYQVEEHAPRYYEISAEVLNADENDTTLRLVKFAVEQPLDKKTEGFEFELLFCLNLLQENAGNVDVFPSSATRQDYIGTVALDWEVFPAGSVDELLASFTKSGAGVTAAQSGVMANRIKLFGRLKPARYLRGSGGFGSYIGAQYADDLVVFENVRYGNALYILYEDWEIVSKRSRIDLLKGTNANFDRIRHAEGWEDAFSKIIKRELRKRGLNWR